MLPVDFMASASDLRDAEPLDDVLVEVGVAGKSDHDILDSTLTLVGPKEVVLEQSPRITEHGKVETGFHLLMQVWLLVVMDLSHGLPCLLIID